MKRFADFLCMTSLGCMAGHGLLAAQPTITIAPSPNPRIAIVPIEGAGSAPAAALFAGASSSLQSASFFVDNRTSQPIMAIVVLGTATDPKSSKPRTARMLDEAFQNSLDKPILMPGSRLLVIPPNILIQEANIPHWASGPGASGRPLQAASNWFGTVSAANISIDSIVFASGEVDGPDTEHFMQELTTRKQAADSVLAAIKAGDDSTLSAMSNQQIQPNDDHFSEWQRRFSQHYLSNSDPAVRATETQILQGYPVPPRLFRAAAATSN
jgi:hypothetical protein